MGYRSAMEAAGAEVLDFEYFGSYQGDWWAHVRVDGNEGWINGSYGSCSYCDAFQAEFDYSWDEEQKDPEAYKAKLCGFGKKYTNRVISTDEALEEAARNLGWDSDAQEMYDWIAQRAGKQYWGQRVLRAVAEQDMAFARKALARYESYED